MGECDRMVTVLTKDQGKMTGLAKGCRRLTSSKLSILEPGNIAELFWVKTQGAPLITQAKILWSVSDLRHGLAQIKQLSQILEIVDTLFSEGQAEEELFELVAEMIRGVSNTASSYATTKLKLEQLVTDLGYQDPQEVGHASLLDYVSVLADRPLKSFEYLTVKRYNTA